MAALRIFISKSAPRLFSASIGNSIAIECPQPTEEWMNNSCRNTLLRPICAKRIEEEREADFSYFVPSIGRFRTNLFQQRGQWCLAMRYVKTQVPSFEELGLLEQIKKIAESPRGIVLVAGSTGSRQIHDAGGDDRAHQREFQKAHHHAGRSDRICVRRQSMRHRTARSRAGYAVISSRAQTRSAQDPDIIMIGEMRDSTSFTAAMSAADTGHLVLSTLHTTNAAQSVEPHPGFFQGGRTRANSPATRGHTAGRGLPAHGDDRRRGRMTPALEILINTPTVKKLIEENRLDKLPARRLKPGKDDGMQNFNQALFQLVKDGKVSEKEALAQGDQPAGAGDEFQRHLPRRRSPHPAAGLFTLREQCKSRFLSIDRGSFRRCVRSHRGFPGRP